MAADTVSSLSGWTVATSVLHYGILKNYFERPGLKSLCTDLGDGAGMGGLVFKTPVWNPVSETFAAHTEAGSITATSQADTSFDITVAQQVLDVQVSDEALWVIDGAGWSNYVEQRAMAFADQADYRLSALIASFFDDFTGGANPEGTAGTALTLETILSARAALQVATGPPARPASCCTTSSGRTCTTRCGARPSTGSSTRRWHSSASSAPSRAPS